MAIVIGISGASRCGKGELSKNLKERLEKQGQTVVLVGQDSFDTNAQKVKLPPGSNPEAAYEYTDSIDFDRFVGAVNAATQIEGAGTSGNKRSQIVIVEGFRAFHESGRLMDGKVSLTRAMKVRFWLEISKETCHKRRMATTKVPEDLFNNALWFCHAQYKAEVFGNVSKGVTPPLVTISGELTTSEILEKAMAQITPLLGAGSTGLKATMRANGKAASISKFGGAAARGTAYGTVYGRSDAEDTLPRGAQTFNGTDTSNRVQQFYDSLPRGVRKSNGGAAAPVPRGIGGKMILSNPADLKDIFDMIDEHKEGLLNRSQARSWLRCAGWCLPNEDLDQMLSESRVGAELTRKFEIGYLPKNLAKDKTLDIPGAEWSLDDLLHINATNQERENFSVQGVRKALRTLSGVRDKISREQLFVILQKLHNISADDFEQSLDLAGIGSQRELLDIDTHGDKLLAAIVDPTKFHNRDST